MRFCRKCIQTDTRPGIIFDSEGVCSACRVIEKQQFINWKTREQELRHLAAWAKLNSHGGFDCVIGVSGGKDSHFQSFYARDRLGLNPLLVCCAPENITEVGRNNLENLVQHGFDLLVIRPNPSIMKELVRRAFFEYGNPEKPMEIALFAVAWIIAVKFDIPMVIQGENPVHTLGVVKDMSDSGDAYNIREHDTIAEDGAEAKDGIEPKDLLFYQFPSPEEVANIKSIWLSHYAKEWSFTGNTEFAISKGLRGRPKHNPRGTGKLSAYCSIDSDIHILNQLLKYFKFGFGFVTDEVCYDIREGRLTREEGIKLVKLYDGRLDEKYIRGFCGYFDITIEEFWATVDRFINKDLFYRDPAILWRVGSWMPKFTVGEDYV